MPHAFNVTVIGSSGEDSFSETLAASGDSKESAYPSVPAAKDGALTTRTDANTGVLTMDSGHGFITGDKIDVFWSGGSRRAMDATVTGDAVAVDGGSGDDLPADETDVTAMVPFEVPFVVDGDEVIGVGVYSPVAGYVVFVDEADAEISDATYTLGAGVGKAWNNEMTGADNPLAGVVTSVVKFSHGDSSSARDMKAVAVFN